MGVVNFAYHMTRKLKIKNYKLKFTVLNLVRHTQLNGCNFKFTASKN